MNEKPRSSSCFVLSVSVPISFILGLIIGLVVLGWWLWPVEWSGGDISMIEPGAQMDYLSATVSSFAYDQDEERAQARFTNLGDGREAVLAALYEAEPERAREIENFAAAVGASDALTAPAATEETEPAAEPTDEAVGGVIPLVGRLTGQPVMALGAVCLGLLFLVALILIITLFRRRRKPETETVSAEPKGSEPEEYSFQEPESLVSPGEYETVAVEELGTRPEELPDWLDIPEPDSADTENLEDTAPRAVITDSFEELPVSTDEELTDEDIAAITSQDFATAGTTLGGAAIFGDAMTSEGIHFPGSGTQSVPDETAQGTDFWVETPQEQGEEVTADEIFDWLEPVQIGETTEIAPLIMFRTDETAEETEAKFSQMIETVPGINPDEAAQLRSAGVDLPLLLLRDGATPEGRRRLSEETGVDEPRLLHWVKFVDLYRIKGVDRAEAELLHAAGIEGVPALAASDAAALHQWISSFIEGSATYPTAPSYNIVEAWIEQARRLPHAVME